jgi:hypothetical protein
MAESHPSSAVAGAGKQIEASFHGVRYQVADVRRRVVLRVTDLPSWIERLKSSGVRFRNQMEVGPGGRQIQIASEFHLAFEKSRRTQIWDRG